MNNKAKNLIRFTRLNHNLKGFTLIELLVSISIIAAMSGLFIVNYHGANKRSELGIIKQKLVSDIRLAQNYSLSSKTYDGSTVPKGGWGVHFNLADPTHYIIFADQDGDYEYNDDSNKDKAIEIKTLPAGIIIDSLSLANTVDIVFFPPEPMTYINALPNISVQITLKENINNSTATVSVNFFGLIDTN
ncbi:prepilin-type N-terminal cleavage/methylation domain-containing protein [Patescibacteria group bacterium]|nr:prepilin-type N-terminal cleavage/methylation domain-containing protein [Patescibacteria group bacterium]